MIDNELQQELRNRFNPDGSSLRNHQLRMLEMLKYLDSVCQKHNIQYWLSSGTVLGAVRHGGFIPWDDDLDIELMSEDYKKLVKVLESDQSKYFVQTKDNDKNYFLVFAKLRDKQSEIVERSLLSSKYKYRGVYVDLFTLDFVNSQIGSFTAAYTLLLSKVGEQYNNILFRGLFRVLKCLLYLLIPILKLLTKILPHNHLRHSYGSFFNKAKRYKEHILPLSTIEFEGHTFPAPYNCDLYLTTIYGDYNKFPNFDKIDTHTSEAKIF